MPRDVPAQPLLTKLAIGLSLCLALLLPGGTNATTWHVPDEFPTIQAGVDAAAAGDTVLIADGIYTGDGNRDIDFLGKAICVRSASGDPTACVVDCQASASANHRGFIFQSAESPEARLEGISIVNGWVENWDDPWPEGLGGGILVIGAAAPTLRSLVLEDNTAMSGGGLFVGEDSAPTLSDCAFNGNEAWWGSGGGLSSISSSLAVTDCRFTENTGYQAGGAVAQASTESLFERCEFYGNTVQYGGGLDCFAGTDCELIDCTFAENAADYGGGLAIWFDSSCTLRNCTLVANSAAQGGGIYVESSAAVLLYSIIVFSNAGSAIKCVEEESILANCCNLFGNADGDWVDCVANSATIPGNISADPLFCGEANPDQPYTLTAGSPCGPDHYPCSLMGAWPVGCGATGAGPELPHDAVFELGPAVPNPFNPCTTIAFALREPAIVRMGIYDLSGRLVQLPIRDEHRTAGNHQVEWRGRDERGRTVPSGTYVVRLQAAGNEQTRKVALIR